MLSALGFLHQAGGAPVSLLPSFSLGGMSASIVDDAKSKASSAASAAQGKAEAAGQQLKHDLNKAGAAAGVPKKGIELYSPQFYLAGAIGGTLACGTTHFLVTPLDLVKCRKQVDKNLYKSNMDGWSKIIKQEGGIRSLYTGGGPTLIGYSMQGAAKYGFFEYFKKTYSDLVGPENFKKYKSLVYCAGSASAEVIADCFLVPMETVKVRMQTTIPPFQRSTIAGVQTVIAKEGVGALYRSLTSLWGRQVPYTMMKFVSFEKFVEAIYNYLGKPKSSFNSLQQLGVSAVAGYGAGVFCAIVSHPADTMVSKLNAPLKPGQAKPTVGSIYQEIGFNGLWGGLTTRIFMIGTLTCLQWLIYDWFKVQVGLPTTGAPAPEQK